MKPIETRIYGCRFRSRLEARWAVFFDRMGFNWEYEPQGFELQGFHYLPDFRVWTPQKHAIWYEVKPAFVHSDHKFDLFRKSLSNSWQGFLAPRAFLLSGDPRQFFSTYFLCPRCGIPLNKAFVLTDKSVRYECQACQREIQPYHKNVDFSDGILSNLDSKHTYIYRYRLGSIEVDQEHDNSLDLFVYTAAVAAMSARFEHGEQLQYR